MLGGAAFGFCALVLAMMVDPAHACLSALLLVGKFFPK
jgi:hypothetical protein